MDIATTLLEYGASANAESKAGFTPLHLSSQVLPQTYHLTELPVTPIPIVLFVKKYTCVIYIGNL